MQALCHHDVQGEGLDETLSTLAEESSASCETLDYARRLCRYFIDRGSEIDAGIQAVLKRWELNRLACVERNVIRVATIELVCQDVPPKVVLNEAIEIAREFGSAESSKFVNGVLDAVWKDLSKEH